MHVERYSDRVEFRELVTPYLLADEVRHNLLLGLLATLVDRPDVYPTFHLWLVRAGERVVGMALRTPPHLLVLAAPRDDGALDVLSDAICEEGMDLPGVQGGLPEADRFAELHARATAREVGDRMAQGIYGLESVADVPVPSGASRRANADDLELLVAWHRAFHAEVSPIHTFDEERVRRGLVHSLGAGDGAGHRLWEDDGPVCLVGFGGPTPTGLRVGPVYTPPEKRGHGYATALVAEVSREILALGRRFCFLYTDMANPTSNAIYRRIGYRLVCSSAMIRFADPTASGG